MKQLLKLLCALLALTLVAAACSDDTDDTSPGVDQSTSDGAGDDGSGDDDGGGTDDDTSDDSTDGDSTDGDSTDGDSTDGDSTDGDDEPSTAATGEPIYVGYIGSIVPGSTSFETRTAGIEAALAPINAAGGIDNRPIELLTCDDTGDPNVGVECVDSLIEDGVVTFVGSLNQSGATANPVITEAGFVTIGGFMLTAGDNGVADFYTTDGGNIVGGPGQFSACASLGAKRVSIAFLDIPAAQIIGGLVDSMVKPAWPDTEIVGNEPLALDLADFAPVAAKIIGSDADCVMALSTNAQNIALIRALRDQGYEGRIAGNSANLTTPDAVAQLGEDADGLILSQYYDQTSDGWNQYVEELAAVHPEASPDGWGVGAWLAGKIAALVIAETGPDPAAITAGVPEIVVDYDTNGLTEGPIDWSVPGDNPLGIVNLRNDSWIPVEVVNGEDVPDPNGFVSVFATGG